MSKKIINFTIVFLCIAEVICFFTASWLKFYVAAANAINYGVIDFKYIGNVNLYTGTTFSLAEVCLVILTLAVIALTILAYSFDSFGKSNILTKNTWYISIANTAMFVILVVVICIYNFTPKDYTSSIISLHVDWGKLGTYLIIVSNVGSLILAGLMHFGKILPKEKENNTEITEDNTEVVEEVQV